MTSFNGPGGASQAVGKTSHGHGGGARQLPFSMAMPRDAICDPATRHASITHSLDRTIPTYSPTNASSGATS